jgi:hypothetical protein
MASVFMSLALAFLLSIFAACGGGTGSTSGGNSSGMNTGGSTGGNTGGSTGSTGNTGVSVQHIVVVMLENQDYSDVVGSSFMPFLNTLAQQNALATQFYANTHPSIGNYMMVTAGTNPTGDQDSWAGTWPGDNIARQLTAAGKTWKVYAESLPSVGYTGGDTADQYIRHHNPFVYFDDVLNSTTQLANVVPFTQFSTDVAGNALPNYSFVVPNNSHNGHDCPTGGSTCPLSDHLLAADTWLSNNISTLLHNITVMANTVVVVTFDEANLDNTNGGGRVATVFAGPLVKSGFQSTTIYQFPSLLRFSLESLSVTSFPNQASSAPSMSEFLK